PPTSDKIARLSEVIAQIAPQNIATANLNLGTELFNTLMQNVNNATAVLQLDLSGNGLGDEALSFVLQNFPNLQQIIFSNNQLSSDGVNYLANYLTGNSQLKTLVIAYNNFSADSYCTLIRAIGKSNVVQLDVSGVDLNDVDFSQISTDLKISGLRQLSMNNCR